STPTKLAVSFLGFTSSSDQPAGNRKYGTFHIHSRLALVGSVMSVVPDRGEGSFLWKAHRVVRCRCAGAPRRILEFELTDGELARSSERLPSNLLYVCVVLPAKPRDGNQRFTHVRPAVALIFTDVRLRWTLAH